MTFSRLVWGLPILLFYGVVGSLIVVHEGNPLMSLLSGALTLAVGTLVLNAVTKKVEPRDQGSLSSGLALNKEAKVQIILHGLSGVSAYVLFVLLQMRLERINSVEVVLGLCAIVLLASLPRAWVISRRIAKGRRSVMATAAVLGVAWLVLHTKDL